MTWRDHLAKESPITFNGMIRIWGDPGVNLNDDNTRAAFFAVWAMVNYEYADAMLAESDKVQK